MIAAQVGLLMAIAGGPAAAPPIVVFDLTYALRFDVHDAKSVAAAWDHAHFVATLQGIVNRHEPRLYVRFVENQGLNVDDFWLERLSEPGQWLAGRRRVVVRDVESLVREFRRSIRGVVLYDPNVAATSNLASTIAGVEDLVAIRYDADPQSLYTRLVRGGPKLRIVRRLLNEDGAPMFTGRGTVPETAAPSTGSAKCDAYLWLKHRYIDTGKVDATYAAYYIDSYWMQNPAAATPNQHTLTNHDYFIAKKAFFFDLSVWGDEAPIDDPQQPTGADLRTLTALLRSAYEHGGRERMIEIGGFTPWAFKYTNCGRAGGSHDAVPTEWETVKVASAFNAYLDPDAIAMAAQANASFYMHFPLKARYPQKWVTRDELVRRGYLTRDGKVDFRGRQFIIFYVGDYDSPAWIYQWMPKNWMHPQRGSVPLMWCINPAADRRAPMALDWMRRTATPNDYFAAADNGAGYLTPGMLQEPRPISELPSGVDAWVRHCTPYYERWGMTITGFVIDGYAPGLDKSGLDAYAKFSPNGIVPQKVPASLLHGTLPVLRAGYDLGDGDPKRTAALIAERVRVRTIPFHWFRGILKGVDWYAGVQRELRAIDPNIELLDAPTFFELYRAWLETNPDAANGKIDSPR